MKTPATTLLSLACLIAAPVAFGAGSEYRIEYDYVGQGDDWYGRPGPIEPRLDYHLATDIPTQQGDDFRFGYEPSLVGLGQGPAVTRTQGKHSAYDFRFTGLTSCVLEIPPRCAELIFEDDFE